MGQKVTWRKVNSFSAPRYIPLVDYDDLKMETCSLFGGFTFEQGWYKYGDKSCVLKDVFIPTQISDMKLPIKEMYDLRHPNLMKCLGIVRPSGNKCGLLFEKNNGMEELDNYFFLNRKSPPIPMRQKIRMIYDLCDVFSRIEKIIFPNIIPLRSFGFDRFYIKSCHEKDEKERKSLKIQHISIDVPNDFHIKLYQMRAPESYRFKGRRDDLKTPVFSFSILSTSILFESLQVYPRRDIYDYKPIDELVSLLHHYRPRFNDLIRKDMIQDGCEWVIDLLERCWMNEQSKRPSFDEIKKEMGEKMESHDVVTSEMDLKERTEFVHDRILEDGGKFCARFSDNKSIIGLKMLMIV